MKKIFLFLTFILQIAGSYAQILDPVKVTPSVRETGNGNYELVFAITIDKGWHVFSQFLEEDGPIASSINFEEKKGYKAVGKASETGIRFEAKEPLFEDMLLVWFEEEAEFIQAIKVTAASATVKGYFEYQACNDRSCLPPTPVEFSFQLKGQEKNDDPLPPHDAKSDTTSPLNSGAPCDCAEDLIDSLLKKGLLSSSPSSGTNVSKIEGEDIFIPIDTASVTYYSKLTDSDEKGCDKWWLIFLKGFGGGLLALLTPCVFPMIPLTVSFFLKKSQTRRKGIKNAITYALSIILIYVLIGFVITLIMGPGALNELSTNAIFNLIFFFIFIVFAISFLGAFEITLPGSWVNKSETLSEHGGLLGIFFMAFTLALVSFSCTGPIIGTVLVDAAVGGSYCGPIVVMTGFATALALPFGVFALFPQLLHSLPKSGGWLNVVKVVIGFLELALALKFLSVPDLTYHWGILDREVFLVLWITIFSLLGIYLLGFIRFSHDSEIKHLSLTRLFFAIAVFSFTFYLIPGLWGAPLKAISGLTPPKSTQDFDMYALNHSDKLKVKKKYDDVFHAPPGIDAFFDYNQGMAYARMVNRPVLLDFTGWGCVNCRKMEEYVWSDAEVTRLLNEEFVLISLYVDDRTSLPEQERYVTSRGEKVRTVGNKLTDFQVTYLRSNAQPRYVMLDADGKLLGPLRDYDTDVDAYVAYLNSGLEEFRKRENSM